MGQGWRRTLTRLGLGSGGAAIALTAAYARFVEPYFEPAIRDVEISTPFMDAAQDGLKIAVVADLHMGSPSMTIERLYDIVDQINRLNPDIVLLPGDMFLQDSKPMYDVLGVLQAIERPMAASLGNHEHHLHDYHVDNIVDAFERYGIPILVNDSMQVETRLGPVWITGLDDAGYGEPDYKAAFENVPEGATVLNMTHSPDGFLMLDGHDPVSLSVAGDTHCGQVNIFGVRPALWPPGKHIQTMDHWLGGVYDDLPEGNIGVVSCGIGTSFIHARLAVPPEIPIVTLRHGDQPEILKNEL